MSDPFDLPPIATKTTRAIRSAMAFIAEQSHRHADARDTLKGLVRHHDAKLTFPSYRTAFRCGGIYTEAATSCDLSTAKLLILSYSEKAERYIWEAGDMDLFDQPLMANG